jgi:hypothetical protein
MPTTSPGPASAGTSDRPTSAPTGPPLRPASAPASAPSSLPGGGEEDAARCLDEEGDLPLPRRIELCQRYLERNPSGARGPEVVQRLKDLEDAEEELRFLEAVRHPRQPGDISLLMVGGANTPSGIIGVQGGYYLSPQLHLSGGLGLNDRGGRFGLIGRGYLYDTKFSPMASLALSFTLPRQNLVPQPIPGTEAEEVIPVRFGTSALAHASAGVSLRYSYGLSGSAEIGYAQALYQQELTNIRDQVPLPEAQAKPLRDGGFFFALSIGITLGGSFLNKNQ